MLTKVEMEILDLTFIACCNKGFTIPFAWTNGRMVVDTNPKVLICNWISWILLIPTIIFEFKQIPVLISDNDINGLILHGILTMFHVNLTIIKVNIWLFKEDMVQLVNHMLHINWTWGTIMNYLHVYDTVDTVKLNMY